MHAYFCLLFFNFRTSMWGSNIFEPSLFEQSFFIRSFSVRKTKHATLSFEVTKPFKTHNLLWRISLGKNTTILVETKKRNCSLGVLIFFTKFSVKYCTYKIHMHYTSSEYLCVSIIIICKWNTKKHGFLCLKKTFFPIVKKF